MKEHNPNLDYYTYPIQKDQSIDVHPVEPAQSEPQEGPSAAQSVAAEATTKREADAKRTFSHICFSVVGMLVIWLSLVYGISAVAASAFPELRQSVIFSIFTSTLSLILIAIPSLYLMLRKVPALTPQKQSTPLGGARFTVLVFISMGIMIAGALISNIAMAVFTTVTGIEPLNSLELVSSAPIWVTLVSTVILSPIFEEILCRKILLTRLLPYGEVTAIVLSSLLFAFIHGNLFQIVYAFGAGVILALLYLRTGRLRYCCTLHIVLNALGSLVSVFLLSKIDPALLASMEEFLAGLLTYEEILPMIWENGMPLTLMGIYTGVQYAAALAGLVLLFVWRKHFRAQRKQGDLSMERTLSLTFTSVGGIVLLVFSVLFTMLNMGLFPGL